MPFDGLTIRAITHELNTILNSARIDKIHQPDKDELFFTIRQFKNSIKLVISANPRWARIHCSSEKRENPARPSSFCMLLRKYLEGGKIKEVKQVGLERIVHIRIEALDDFREWKDKLLICEFMGRHSNIILINPENGIIIDAIKKYGSEQSSYREILPGKEYVSPPTQGKLDPWEDSFMSFGSAMYSQKASLGVSDALFNVFAGISPYSARQICAMAGVEHTLPVDQCGDFELGRLFSHTRELIAAIDRGDIRPRVQFDRKQPTEFTPYEPQVQDSITVVAYPSMNDACDTYYLKKMSLIRLESMQGNLSRTIRVYLDKAYKKKFYQEGDLAKAQENEKYKNWGELLTAYAHLYQKGDTIALLSDFYTGEDISVTLDPRYTPIQNAQRFFKIYNKSRAAQKHLQRLMAENQEEIDYLESVLVFIKGAENPEDLAEVVEELEKGGYLKGHARRGKPKDQRSRPRVFKSSDGLEIMVGRNNRQNDWLTLRDAGRNDLWLHTKEIPGTHVIISLPRTIKSIHDVPDRTLEEAATLAAHYSKASESDKVPVDYTFTCNVKKPSGAKPGMVIYDNYWTIMVNPCSAMLHRLLDSQD